MARWNPLTKKLHNKTETQYRYDKKKTDGRNLQRGEADAVEEFDSKRLVDHGYAMLVAIAIEDAMRLIVRGHPRQWWQGDRTGNRAGLTYNTSITVYEEACQWFFFERDPDRVFSLDWCVGALNAWLGMDVDAEALRARAYKSGICPPQEKMQCATN